MRKVRIIIMLCLCTAAITGCSIKVTKPNKQESAGTSSTIHAPAEENQEKLTADTSTQSAQNSNSEAPRQQTESQQNDPMAIQKSTESSFTWNGENGDVIETSIDTTDGRYKMYSDVQNRITIENEEGKKIFGFVWTGEKGLDFWDEAIAPGNEILTKTDRLITVRTQDSGVTFYETVYMIPGCDSSLILMTEHSEALIESVFSMLNIKIIEAPNGDPYEYMPKETSSAYEEPVTENYIPEQETQMYVTEAPAPEQYDQNVEGEHRYYTVTYLYEGFLGVTDSDGVLWSLNVPTNVIEYHEGDMLDVIVNPELDIIESLNEIYPGAVYRDGERTY